VLPIRLLTGEGLTRSAMITGQRIWALGWRYRYRRTEAATRHELCEICEVRESQMYQHLGELRAAGVLEYERPRDGRYVFELRDGDDGHLDPGRGETPAVRGGYAPGTGEREGDHLGAAAEIPENRNLPSMIDVVVESHAELDCVNQSDHQQQSGHVLVFGGECEGGADRVRKTGLLAELGVLEPTRSELAGLAHVDDGYLEAWGGYMRAHPELGVGWLVVQVRAGDRPPMVSGDRDPAAYVSGRYAEYIQS